MSALLEPARARFNGYVSDMSPRDRALFLGLTLSLYGGLLLGSLWLGSSILGDLRSRSSARESVATRLEAMESELKANSAKAAEIETVLRENANQDLPSFVEKAALKLSLGSNLKAVKAKGTTSIGNIEEKSFNIELDKISLGQLTELLFEMETTGYPLRIRTTRLKTVGPPGQRLLSGTLEVSRFKLDESGTTTEGN